MKMFPALEKKYTKDSARYLEAMRLANQIAFAPVVFQAARLMRKFGVFRMLADAKEGLTMSEIAEQAHITPYAAKVLLEASLTAGTVSCSADRFTLNKAGWFLLTDPIVGVNMDLSHDVLYKGMFHLEEALLNGKPEGLKELGSWKTIYEGLSSLPDDARRSWFAFDHYFSDSSFDEALEVVFARKPRRLLDVGGNTGRWALRCVAYNGDVEVTIMDLPQQLALMKQQTAAKPGAGRIDGYAANLLDPATSFPNGYDVIWMSQFLDCFSEDEITSIVSRAAASMDENARLYVMETLWDRQADDIAAFCLTQISLYFSVMANGNSKMYHSDDLIRCLEAGGLEIETIHDGFKGGHSLLVCKKRKTY